MKWHANLTYGSAVKIPPSIAALVLLAVGGVFGWLLVYRGNLPDTDQMSQFAPSAQSLISDSCFASPSMGVPFKDLSKCMML